MRVGDGDYTVMVQYYIVRQTEPAISHKEANFKDSNSPYYSKPPG